MPKTPPRLSLLSFIFICQIAWCADSALWCENLPAALKAAAADPKPVLILVRNMTDVGSIDVGHWIEQDSLKKTRQLFHCVKLWHPSPELKEFPYAPRSGLLFLDAQSRPIAIEEPPLRRADLVSLLEKIAASPQANPELATPPDTADKAKSERRQAERMFKGLSDDLKEQMKELFGSVRAAGNDKKAEAKAREIVKACIDRTLSEDECLRTSGVLMYAIMELDFADEKLRLAEKIKQMKLGGRVAGDAYLDLADDALTRGDKQAALEYWKSAEKACADGESPTFLRTARAMRALVDGKDSDATEKWIKREVLDVVVLVSDMPSYAAAIARWTDKQYFPVLFQDDLFAPKFIDAFKPAQVVLVPPAGKEHALTPHEINGAIVASWTKNEDHGKARNLEVASVDDLHEGLKKLGVKPEGVIFGDGTSGETAGAIALAAGRFQPFEILAVPEKNGQPAKVSDHLSKDAAWKMMAQVRAGLARWNVFVEDGWKFVTLAGAYPYRYNGDDDGYKYGNTYALDDLLGRDEDSTRVAVVGRLLGDAPRSAYQAMCSLFLAPESAFLFNTYGTNPKTIWGHYRMDFSENSWKDKFPLTHLRDKDANIDTFRQQTAPWNKFGLITINSSGGGHDWSVGGGGGSADDFPIGVPCAIHVTHSGSAANPYDLNTLAGRAIWGGAYFYFGSAAEPFLSAFQPPSYYAPRIAAGAPLAAAFRERPGQYFGYPWRLMIVGDPQFRVRTEPVKRHAPPSIPLVIENEKRVTKYERPVSLITALENQIREGKSLDALKAWETASEEEKKNPTALIYARQAASRLMDDAQAKEDLSDIYALMPRILATGPARNFVERWINKLGALAEKKGEQAKFNEWMEAQSTQATPESFKAVFAAWIEKKKNPKK